MLRHPLIRFAGSALFAGSVLHGCAAEIDNAGDEPAVAEQALSACLPDIPPELAVPAGNRLAFLLDATGVQIYDCKASADGSSAAWTFRAPEADLLKRDHIAGSHYAGPTWEALDGSTVVGARLAGASVDPTAIPWLLLQAKSHTGDGRMSEVTFIQRLNTTGGLAPSTGCDLDHLGAEADVPYTALYTFSKAHPTWAKR